MRELYAQVMHTSYAREFCRVSHTHKLFTQVTRASFAHEFFAQVMRASYVMQVIRTNYSHKLRTSFLRKLYTPVMPCKSYAQIIYTSFAHEFCHAFNLRYVYRTDKFISPPLCPRTMQPFTILSRSALPDSPHHTATHNTVIYFHVPRTLTRRAIRPCTVNEIHTQQSRSAW